MGWRESRQGIGTAGIEEGERVWSREGRNRRRSKGLGQRGHMPVFDRGGPGSRWGGRYDWRLLEPYGIRERQVRAILVKRKERSGEH